jgi:serine/threonine protein phosphatase 1
LTESISPWTNASVPDGMRLYAIGDIHGRADLLEMLIGLIEQDQGQRPRAETELIFLGDYVDRGPGSNDVVARLISGFKTPLNTTLLKGNHEDLLLRFLDDPISGLNWLQNGGDTTLLSYGVAREIVQRAFWWGQPGLAEAAASFGKLLPVTHRRLYESLKLSHRVGDYFFAHAGVRPRVALNRQREEDLLWIREEFLDCPDDFEAVVVHGHTPVRAPEDRRNRIGIDTYAFQTGRLTAVGLEGTRRWFLST